MAAGSGRGLGAALSLFAVGLSLLLCLRGLLLRCVVVWTIFRSCWLCLCLLGVWLRLLVVGRWVGRLLLDGRWLIRAVATWWRVLVRRLVRGRRLTVWMRRRWWQPVIRERRWRPVKRGHGLLSIRRLMLWWVLHVVER